MNAEQVYNEVRNRILDTSFAPGTKLKTKELCDLLSVSNGAVREALSRISSEGLAVSEAQKGFTVAPVSREELQDITQTRIRIECLCLTDSIEQGDLDWETRIVSSGHKLARLSEMDNRDDKVMAENWATAHFEFHEALVSACESSLLMAFRKELYDLSERYRRLSLSSRVDDRDVDAEHRRIADACINRNAKEACAAMEDHLRRTEKILANSDAF